MAITLVSVDLSGACLPLAPGVPITVGSGANTTTYQWSTLYSMSNTQLQALNIYPVNNSITIPTGLSALSKLI